MQLKFNCAGFISITFVFIICLTNSLMDAKCYVTILCMLVQFNVLF